MGALRLWLQLSDDTLAAAWGSMDRYHLAWLSVGKPKGIVRGRPMTADEEAAYVREVASQKTAALRMSLDAVERQGMPFRGETGGVAPGQGMGEVPGSDAPRGRRAARRPPGRPAAVPASTSRPRSTSWQPRSAGRARRRPATTPRRTACGRRARRRCSDDGAVPATIGRERRVGTARS